MILLQKATIEYIDRWECFAPTDKQDTSRLLAASCKLSEHTIGRTNLVQNIIAQFKTRTFMASMDDTICGSPCNIDFDT